MHDVLATQITTSAVVVYILQKLKEADWFPWVNSQNNRMQRAFAALAATASAAGVHLEFDSSVGILTISGLVLPNIVHFVGEVIQAFVLQEIVYRGAVKMPKNGG